MKHTIINAALVALFCLPAASWATGKKPYNPKPKDPPPVVVPAAPIDRCATDAWSIRCDDKQAHLAVSTMIGVIVADVARDRPYWQRFAISMAPLTAKEVLDAQSGGTGFSWKDMTWNAVGVAAGLHFGGAFIARQQGQTVVGVAREF